MSHFMKSLQFGYISNKESKDFFLSDDDEDDFNFQYIPANQFKHIVKDVRRQKIKTEEENAWASFIEQQDVEKLYQQLNGINPELQNFNHFGFEEVEKVDREILRLEEDALPEINKRIYKGEYETREDRVTEDKSLKKNPVMKDSGTGSTNFLLTIPEEDFLSPTFERCPKIKHRPRVRPKKSTSDHTLKHRRNHSRKLSHSINDQDYISSPELSPDRLSDTEDTMYARPDPLIAAKILGTQKKISEVLDEIAVRLGRIPLPDGDKDLYRRQQRVMEFSIRFSRNYLYDLGRQITEIRRHVNAITPGFRKKIGRRTLLFHVQAIEHKLASAHQLLLHALSAYCKHIPSSVLKGHPGKLKEILQVVVDLKDFCEKIHLVPNFAGSGDAEEMPLGKDTDNKCSAILSKLRLSSDNESQLISHTTRSTLATAQTPMRSKRRNIRKQVTNRLSMYIADTRMTKNHRNRRTIGVCHKEKIRNSMSNSKRTFNNRPLTPELLYPSPVLNKPSNETNKSGFTKISIPPKEDDIETMVEIIPTDSDAGSGIGPPERFQNVCLDKNSRVQRISAVSQSFQNSEECSKFNSFSNEEELTKKVTKITEEHLSNLVPIIADLMSLIRINSNDSENKSLSSVPTEILMDIIQKHQKTSNFKGNSMENSEGHSSKISLNPNETRTGSKNMQLICMSSSDDSKDLPKFSDASCQANENQSRSKPFEKDRLIQLSVSDKSQFRLLEYRHEYQSSSKSSPMYTDDTQNKPWDVITWVADKLVNELIVDLSKELQMDEVITKLFELEFHEL